MHSSKRLDKQPGAHRADRVNRCAFSDCCGAPITKGGICFECREFCEEDDGISRLPARVRRSRTNRDGQFGVASTMCFDPYSGEEDSSSAFDEMVLRIIRA